MTNSDLKISLYTWMYRVSSHNKLLDQGHGITLPDTEADEESGRFPAILWPAGWAMLHQHTSTGGTQCCLAPFPSLCLQESKLSVSGRCTGVCPARHDFRSPKEAETPICLSAWWAQTLRGQLSTREIICVMVIPDRKGFLTYIYNLLSN